MQAEAEIPLQLWAVVGHTPTRHSKSHKSKKWKKVKETTLFSHQGLFSKSSSQYLGRGWYWILTQQKCAESRQGMLRSVATRPPAERALSVSVAKSFSCFQTSLGFVTAFPVYATLRHSAFCEALKGQCHPSSRLNYIVHQQSCKIALHLKALDVCLKLTIVLPCQCHTAGFCFLQEDLKDPCHP